VRSLEHHLGQVFVVIGWQGSEHVNGKIGRVYGESNVVVAQYFLGRRKSMTNFMNYTLLRLSVVQHMSNTYWLQAPVMEELHVCPVVTFFVMIVWLLYTPQ
jgi:hypothetical protein